MSKYDLQQFMKNREFAYSNIFSHPEIEGSAFNEQGIVKPDIDASISSLFKNESNCTVLFDDETWFTTWGQGSFEHAIDERIVFSTSKDKGETWTEPATIAQSNEKERIAYGAPVIIPQSQRVYMFFFVGYQANWEDPMNDASTLNFIYSDDKGLNWSKRFEIKLPARDINMYIDLIHGWINHPPQIMPTGEVILSFSALQKGGLQRRSWCLNSAEVSVIRMDNILAESDPSKLVFTLLPEGSRGIRVAAEKHLNNTALNRLVKYFKGYPEDSAFNFQEMTVVADQEDRWIGVGRTFLGSPGYTVSKDRGHTWTPVEPLCYGPEGEPIKHPMTMCPLTKTSDGRYILLFTNNDGSQRNANHVWDGKGRTRNPQWMVVGVEIPGEERNAGLQFGEPRLIAEVDDSGETNLKTGISMPQFFEYEGRYFIGYNINKEHIVLDEIPSEVLDKMTPKG